jgi:hypothetical protein
MLTNLKPAPGKRCFGKSASSAKHTCVSVRREVGDFCSAWRSRDVVVELCVLAVFMVHGGRLPGKRAFKESRALARRIVRDCDSFVNHATVIEKSELATFARVTRVLDYSPAYTDDRAREGADDREHSFLTRAEMFVFMGSLPVGAVGVWVVDDACVEAFIRRDHMYERIVARFDGTWCVCTSSDQTHVVPTPECRAELMIFESA